MNTFRKGGLFTDMKMNTTANFHKQMPAYSLPYKKYGPLKRKKSCLSAIGSISENKMNVELLIIHEQ